MLKKIMQNTMRFRYMLYVVFRLQNALLLIFQLCNLPINKVNKGVSVSRKFGEYLRTANFSFIRKNFAINNILVEAFNTIHCTIPIIGFIELPLC